MLGIVRRNRGTARATETLFTRRRTPRPPAGAPPRGGPRSLAPALRRGLFDRNSDQRAPFRPTAVVVAHSVLPEEIFQDEPGVSASFADPAIGDRLALAVD